MLRTFRIAYSLKNTYRVNGIIYSIKQVPLLKRCLPDALYRIRGFKIFANILSGLWEVISAFWGKLFYLLCMVYGAGMLYGSNMLNSKVPESQIFLHIFFLLTLIGTYMNTYLFDPTDDKYYAISLMRMNARTYMLSYYSYVMLRLVIGFLPFTILFGTLRQIPLWLCILMPFFVAGSKLTAVWLDLRRYEKKNECPDENKLSKWDWIGLVVLLAAAYGQPALGIVIPSRLIVALMLLLIVTGIFGIKKLAEFPYYRQLCQQMLADKKSGMDVKVTSEKIIEEASRGKISHDKSITSSKSGFEYFNELFIKRHKKILWNSVLRITVVSAILVAGMTIVFLVNRDIAGAANEMIMKLLPVFLFAMYILNRGTTFTQALFINCDHSMLTYAFYKKPGAILKLFWIRLRELIKINLVPAAVIGGGLSLLLYVSGGTAQPVNYAVITISILAMSVFFSVHYLTIYYLLQPYNADSEIKSGMYKVISWVTYVFCYVMMQVRMSPLLFGGVTIGFTVLYCAAAGILVYCFAGKTFRLRS